MTERLLDAPYFGDCPICGTEGELFALTAVRSAITFIKCAECATIFEASDSSRSGQSEGVHKARQDDEELRPATREECVAASFVRQQSGSIPVTEHEIYYLWAHEG